MTDHDEDRRNLHAARAYLARLLPTFMPLSDAEVRSLALKAGMWSLHEETRPLERALRGHLQGHARLLRGTGSELDRLDAQQLRRPAVENNREDIFPRSFSPAREAAEARPAAPSIIHGSAAAKMRALAERLYVPWLTRLPLPKARMQVSYRATRAFEGALDDAWKVRAPKGGSRNTLHTTLVLAYLAVPEVRIRVKAAQNTRYAKDGEGVESEDARRIRELLRRCGIPNDGAPTLRDGVTQLSYRTTVQANAALHRSLPDEERTLAYLHLDLLALYLTAPDVRAFIDRVLEERAVE
ncbi:hypothetical protein GCM10008959_24390 [Deinococcus seoulensis]|uniref:Uncharacterized protein n=1 Tax=Deinococcus seoulensis TaxID=1837379 RepID=A0ABQ2RRZ8_9DEIO|nr:hypothetical protein [Deinococcus seoulensis]GGR61607.1 hypothetical protein GCM10008959_24390 [Deinococcus seoulensis]